MAITRLDDFEYVRGESQIFDSYVRRMENQNSIDQLKGSFEKNPLLQTIGYTKKRSVQEEVNDLIKRTGLEGYINVVNSRNEILGTKFAQQQEEEPNSIIDIPYIKEFIDNAIEKKKISELGIMLTTLADCVKHDENVPDALKNALSDEKLKKYIMDKLDIHKSDNKGDLYSLKENDPPNMTQKSDAYFEFMKEKEDT